MIFVHYRKTVFKSDIDNLNYIFNNTNVDCIHYLLTSKEKDYMEDYKDKVAKQVKSLPMSEIEGKTFYYFDYYYDAKNNYQYKNSCTKGIIVIEEVKEDSYDSDHFGLPNDKFHALVFYKLNKDNTIDEKSKTFIDYYGGYFSDSLEEAKEIHNLLVDKALNNVSTKYKEVIKFLKNRKLK